MYHQPVYAAIRYVKYQAQGNNTGVNWTNAFPTLQQALDVAVAGDEIWVAQGTYYPTSPYDLNDDTDYYHFRMINGVSILGGFTGSETSASQRNRDASLTILSADIDKDGSYSNNSCHVFYHPSGLYLDNSAVLNGFTITMGYGSSASIASFRDGGGMYNYHSSPTIVSCIFSNNRASNGGGMVNGYDSYPRLTDCVFYQNRSDSTGGGMYNLGSDPVMTNCLFKENSAGSNGGGMLNRQGSDTQLFRCIFEKNRGRWGGGIYNYWNSSGTFSQCVFIENYASGESSNCGGFANSDSSPTLVNCSFIRNDGSFYGGGFYSYNESYPQLINCTFFQNTAYQGGGFYSYINSFPTLINCTFTENDAWYGGGLYTYSHDDYVSEPKLYNCILWDNMAESGNNETNKSGTNSKPQFSYCSIKGSGGSAAWNSVIGENIGNNIDEDPLFVIDDKDTVHLGYGSLCINAGNKDYLPVGITTDIDGETRDQYVDMGSDEFVNSDSDTLSDYEENVIYGTSPTNPDTDNDGLNDGNEAALWGDLWRSDPDNDNLINLLDPDSDNDGIKDGDEFGLWGNHSYDDPDGDDLIAVLDPDSDNDGIGDQQEMALMGPAWNADTDGDGLINALDDDSDNDGAPDGWESKNGFNPLYAPDGNQDPDVDGLTNTEEYMNNTNPFSSDTDQDTMPDGWEVLHGLDPLNPGDRDQDGDEDGLTHAREYELGLDPFNADTDEDGLPDGWETENDLNPLNDQDASEDTDGDTLSNIEEYERNLDPQTNEPPVIVIKNNYQIVDENVTVVLDGSGSHDVDDGIVSFQWALTPSGTLSLSGASTPVASFLSPQAPHEGANFVFTFTVTTTSGQRSSALCTVHVNWRNDSPIADAGADQDVFSKIPVTLNGSASSDADGDIVSWAWEQTGGTQVVLTQADTVTAVFDAPEVSAEEVLTFTLTVIDGYDEKSTDTCQVLVKPIPQNVGEENSNDENGGVKGKSGGCFIGISLL